MGRWVLTICVGLAVACEEPVQRDYNTGSGTLSGGTSGATPGDDATWDCNNLCVEADIEAEYLCLISEVIADGYTNMLYIPTCPNWSNTTVSDEECILCANELGLDDDTCRRYRDNCNIRP